MKKPAAKDYRSFRLPEEIIKWLEREAKKACRSLNGQVSYILRKAKEEEASSK